MTEDQTETGRVAEPQTAPIKANGSGNGSNVDPDVYLLIDVFPKAIQQALKEQISLSNLTEVVMDLGRPPEARVSGAQPVELSQEPVTLDDIEAVTSRIGMFNADNRAGIPRTLHRISAIRNRQGTVIGLTCRVGKVVTGTIDCIQDLIESGKSILLLGPPGVGKTTKLREVAKLLASTLRKRVVIVDTSNEIAGEGDIPHPAVGRARRMQVSTPEDQQDVMIEAVQNHTPEVIIVDEIGTEEEAKAARTIAERGVILIATAHGVRLDSIIKNPTLSDLVGGIQSVTLGDDEAKRRATQKTVLEREKKPTFDIAIEIQDHHTLAIYPNVAEAVDHILRGWTIFPEVRKISDEGNVRVLQSDVKMHPLPHQDIAASIERPTVEIPPQPGTFYVFLYSLNPSFVERIIERLNLQNVQITQQIHEAQAVLALRGNARPGSKIAQLAEDYEIPLYYAKTNTMPQIQRALREALDMEVGSLADRLKDGLKDEGFEDEAEVALREAQEAIDEVLSTSKPVELAPRRSYIRRLQHELVEKHELLSISLGNEPNRRLKVMPPVG